MQGCELASWTMTHREAVPDEDLAAWWIGDAGGDDLDWDWDELRVDREPKPSGPPWYRSPGPLLALISVAAATLVVAVALVIADSGEIPTRPALGTKTVPTGGPGSSRAAATATAPGPSTPAPASSAIDETPADEQPTLPAEVAGPAEPAASAAAPPPLPVNSPGVLAESNPEGPRINVTRSPMSFSPGSSAVD